MSEEERIELMRKAPWDTITDLGNAYVCPSGFAQDANDIDGTWIDIARLQDVPLLLKRIAELEAENAEMLVILRMLKDSMDGYAPNGVPMSPNSGPGILVERFFTKKEASDEDSMVDK